MSAEWKPGDIVRHPKFGNGIVTTRDCHDNGRAHVHEQSGYWDQLFDTTWRPLVVIDAEDREQVERLVKVLAAGQPLIGLDPTNRDLVDAAWVKHTQLALREYANPTPPRMTEPPFAAVVTDGDGVEWIRASRVGDDDHRWWSDHGGWSTWDDLVGDLTIVREGVSE